MKLGKAKIIGTKETVWVMSSEGTYSQSSCPQARNCLPKSQAETTS